MTMTTVQLAPSQWVKQDLKLATYGTKIYYFWSELDDVFKSTTTSTYHLAESNTDGSGFIIRTFSLPSDIILIGSNNGLQQHRIAFEAANGKLYYGYVRWNGSTYSVCVGVSNLDGTGFTEYTLRTGSSVKGGTMWYDKNGLKNIELKVTSSKIYIVQPLMPDGGYDSNLYLISCNLDGTGVTSPVALVPYSVPAVTAGNNYERTRYQVRMVITTSKIHYIWCEPITYLSSRLKMVIFRGMSNLDGSSFTYAQISTPQTGDTNGESPTIDRDGSKVYFAWTDGFNYGGIYNDLSRWKTASINYDGTGYAVAEYQDLTSDRGDDADYALEIKVTSSRLFFTHMHNPTTSAVGEYMYYGNSLLNGTSYSEITAYDSTRTVQLGSQPSSVITSDGKIVRGQILNDATSLINTEIYINIQDVATLGAISEVRLTSSPSYPIDRETKITTVGSKIYWISYSSGTGLHVGLMNKDGTGVAFIKLPSGYSPFYIEVNGSFLYFTFLNDAGTSIMLGRCGTDLTGLITPYTLVAATSSIYYVTNFVIEGTTLYMFYMKRDSNVYHLTVNSDGSSPVSVQCTTSGNGQSLYRMLRSGGVSYCCYGDYGNIPPNYSTFPAIVKFNGTTPTVRVFSEIDPQSVNDSMDIIIDSGKFYFIWTNDNASVGRPLTLGIVNADLSGTIAVTTLTPSVMITSELRFFKIGSALYYTYSSFNNASSIYTIIMAKSNMDGTGFSIQGTYDKVRFGYIDACVDSSGSMFAVWDSSKTKYQLDNFLSFLGISAPQRAVALLSAKTVTHITPIRMT